MDLNEKIKIMAFGGVEIRSIKAAFDKIDVLPLQKDEMLGAQDFSNCFLERKLNIKIDNLISRFLF